MTRGLVYGKLYPPHEGHRLIEHALERCDEVVVVIAGATVESIPLADRVAWVAAEHPTVQVIGERDDEPIDLLDPAVWEAHVAIIRAALVRAALERGEPDDPTVGVVFTSEAYGPELAARLGAAHEAFDPDRTTVPTSASAFRADPLGRWSTLRPSARAGLALRVSIMGAESTGTTTLCDALASALRERGGVFAHTAWVPEEGRRWTEQKLAGEDAFRRALDPAAPPAGPDDLTWVDGDFTDLALSQHALCQVAGRGGSPVVVTDTDAVATAVWYERYVGGRLPALDALAADDPADLYLVTDHVGVPFVQDGMRDGEHLRAGMTRLFLQAAAATGKPWTFVGGKHEERLDAALAAVDRALEAHLTFAAPMR